VPLSRTENKGRETRRTGNSPVRIGPDIDSRARFLHRSTSTDTSPSATSTLAATRDTALTYAPPPNCPSHSVISALEAEKENVNGPQRERERIARALG
jgi:hypothetical protein